MKLTKKQKIFLNKVCNGTWALNSKGEVDVEGDVYMDSINLTEIPVKFGKVIGDFQCYKNQLTSLEGCPSKVGDGFYCSNNQLTSLEFAPTSVGGDFICAYNQLTSLVGAPTSLGGNFYCSNNQLTDYFKNIKEEDFHHWDKLFWVNIFKEYPFLINIGKKYMKNLKTYLNEYPLTKLYLE